MNKVSVHLQNCYGIRKLKHEFDFSQRRAYAIYAANGAMKSSFAQTFKDIADGKESLDRIFPNRVTVRNVTDEHGTDLPQASVLVLPPYDEFFGSSEKTSTLLVNATLRNEFEQLYGEVEKSKTVLLRAMAVQSASKKKLADEIALAFTKVTGDEQFYKALDRIKNELADQKDAPLADVPYDLIFDPKVVAALSSKVFRDNIEAYVKRYNELLTASTFFKSGIFEYYNGSQIAKALSDNGFFEAKHTITLRGSKVLSEITSQKQLEDLVNKELATMASDPALQKTFTQIKKLFEKNAEVREFHTYISREEHLLPHLSNIDLFKEKVWLSYFKANQALYDDLMAKYSEARVRRKEIEEQANKERSQWEAAIELFNDRFFVPFRLEAKNKIAVSLGRAPILELGYTFTDPTESTPVTREALLTALSQGEKKALYILNIIFEIEVRRQTGQETLFVVDDIADSFDYKNKYAIIQYLQEISEGPEFKLIILTHNFDFFRTANLRNVVAYSGCLMATKSDTEINLVQALGIRNPFVNDWKERFFLDKKKRIASIPFMRNLIEYIDGCDGAAYARLTSLLHWKSDSETITQGELDDTYNQLFATSGSYTGDAGTPVVEMIQHEAAACLAATAGVNFENKIVLAIAIRLAAERYMVRKISDASFVGSIDKNQTQALVKRFQKDFRAEVQAIRTLKNVELMTPENVHLNAFMYEPIMDMSDDHLRKLYEAVTALS
jgi:hypothetical protein